MIEEKAGFDSNGQPLVYCVNCKKFFNILETQNIYNLKIMAFLSVCNPCFDIRPPFIIEAENKLIYKEQLNMISNN